jgi:hypothetical protein
MNHLFPNFLTDETEYAQAEAFWADLWERTSPFERARSFWRPNWFVPQPPKDANPIFTAVSDVQKKGIRIIQYEATLDGIELDFWIDTFGGAPTDPAAIRELVIACALSTEASHVAFKLMSSWVVSDVELVNLSGLPQGFMAIQPSRPRWRDFTSDFDFGALTPAA